MQCVDHILATPLAVAAAEAGARHSAELGRQGEGAASRPQSGDTPHRSVVGLTCRDIEREVYERLGWPR
jgi:hypothetical protein